MRWDGQAITADDGALPGLDFAGLAQAGLVRSVRTPEFAGITFHEVHAKSALSHVPAASKMPFRWTVNPYRGCSHACTYCLSPETLVLLADGRQKPIRDIRVGDLVVGTEPDGKSRRFVQTEVHAAWSTTKRAYRVTLRDGTEIVASGDHRFLTVRGWKHVTGATAEDARRPHLTTGDALMGFGFLAGVTGPAITRKLDILGRAVRSTSDLGVVSVEDLGFDQQMVDITTGTGDFVANGVVSHNCFARPTHEYLELDAGKDFDTQVVVKVNVDQVLRAELARPSWTREPVALGTNTDPYQRAEGRYRLMPGIIGALADSGTPFSILTKGTLLRRDLPLLVEAQERVAVGLGVSLAMLDEPLQQSVEPGTPAPRARLDLVRAVRAAGLPCGVMVAPVLPWLTDSTDHLRRLLDAVADAGATGVTVLPLHLKPGTREWYLAWLEREHPHLVAGYGRVYARTYALKAYREWLWERVRPLLEERGFGSSGHRSRSGATGRYEDDLRAREGAYPAGSLASAHRSATAGSLATGGALAGLPADGSGLALASADVEQVLF
ncbi:Rv2578c family radical SAM protein [Xylanimonas protaetiae]|uniref:Radical SAM protein n=1 Tax=Xylanimonas protaetiae TaxID=2509457 RepID=A0A4P6F2A6_9MICO|nr:Rv2578c family radical SAM protein [Xylanimonas protaetiae]QAY69672.1 radical SAM protein [Xylanimonas protaetiae]